MGGAAKIIKKIISIPIKIVQSVIKLATNVVSGFMGAFGMSFDAPSYDSGAGFEAEQQGIKVNKQSNVAGIPVIYGQRKVGGTRIFIGSEGDRNKHLYVVLAVAEGEIDSFTGLWINDERQQLTGFAADNTKHTLKKNNYDGEHSTFYIDHSRATFQFFTGTETQSASTLLLDDDVEGWTTNHRLQGVAYVACKFEWVKAEFNKDNGEQTLFNPWNGIPTIQVEIKGKKVLPVGTNASTPYGSSGFTDANNTTHTSTYEATTGSFVYSTNPADCLLDYLRNKRYGKSLNDNRISFDSFYTAGRQCNTAKDYGGSLGSVDHFGCNLVLNTEDTIFNNTKKLLQTCRGFLPYVNGKYQLKIEAQDTAPENLFEITDDAIIGQISVNSPDKNGLYNEARVTFPNKEKDYEPDVAVYSADGQNGEPDHLATDGEKLLLQIGSAGITEKERAVHYAKYLVDRSRQQMQVSLRITSEGQNLVAGELVTITHAYKSTLTGVDLDDYMFKAPTNAEAASYTKPKKIWRITTTRLNYDGTVDLTLIEHQNNIYTITAQQEDRDLGAVQRVRKQPFRPWIKPWPGPPLRPGPVPIPPPSPIPPKDGPVAVSVGTDGTGSFISFKTDESDLGFITHIQYDLSLNNGTPMSVRRTAGSQYSDVYYTIHGTSIKPGDQVKYTAYKVYSNQQILKIQGPQTVTISGSGTKTVSSTNSSQGGYA